MEVDPEADAADGARASTETKYTIDAREVPAVQVGEGNVQFVIYNYGTGPTWTDRAAPPPLVDRSGHVESPYRGLNWFEEDDAAFFVGRETATRKILQRMSDCLDGSGLLVVSGASGSGKSSLLRAGVLPRLRKAGLADAPGSSLWPCLLFTPKHAPLDELAVRVALLARLDAAAVRRELGDNPAGFALTARQAALTAPVSGRSESTPEPRLLLVIDQFEQLFSQCPDEEQQRAFIMALHAATSRNEADQRPAAQAVLVVRADFEAHCAEYPQLSEAVQRRYLVTPMTPRELRMAVTGPARTAGSSIDDDLVEVLMEEVGNRLPRATRAGPGVSRISPAGVLPLLSYALDQAWRHRTGDSITLADYERTGGIERAVATSAENAYKRLTAAQQIAARQIFIRLTATSPDGADTANEVRRTELIEGKSPGEADDVTTVLEKFAAARLITLTADTVEISHEVLLTAWPLLRDEWLAETHAQRIIRTRLRNTAAEWENHSHDSSYLYGGSLLQAAVTTAAQITADSIRHPQLSKPERDFLDASTRADRRKGRRRQGITALLTALTVGFAAASVYAFSSRQDAIRQRDVAASGQLILESETLGETNPRISDLEAVAAWRLAPSSQARYAMRAAASRPSIAALSSHEGGIWSVAFSPNGKILATGDDNGTARLWDLATQQPIGASLAGHGGTVYSVAFSPNGKILATGSEDGTVRLWDVLTGHQFGHTLHNSTKSVQSVAFSPNGKILAVGSNDGLARLWDIVTGHLTGHPLVGYTKGVKSYYKSIGSVAFSPDGKILATGSDDGRARLWNVATRKLIGGPIAGHAGSVTSVAFSPNGKILATGNIDGTARRWDVATHRPLGGSLSADSEPLSSVAFSPDGQTLATGSFDGSARLWNVANGQLIGNPLAGGSAPVESVAFSPGGKTLATGSTDDTIRLWDVAMYLPTTTLTASTGAIWSVAFSHDGKILATGNDDGTARLWNIATHRPFSTPLVGHAGAIFSVAFSPNGKLLATGSDSGTALLWDIAIGKQASHPLTSRAGTVWSMAFNPNGKILAVGSDKGMQLWNVATSKPIGHPLIRHTVTSVAFSPNGKILATVGNGATQLWDVNSGKPVGHPLIGTAKDALSVAFSPNNRLLATAGGDGIQLWDVTTRQRIGNLLTSASGPILSVAFSPDGRTLAGGGFEGTARFWDVATRQPIGGPLTGDSADVDSVAFSPKSQILATSDDAGTTRLWNVSYLTGELQRLCTLAQHSFTLSEWARYVPHGPEYQKVCP